MEKIKLECNIYDANRTNTMAFKPLDGPFDIKRMLEAHGITLETICKDIDFCAKTGDDEFMIRILTHVVNELLSAYELQKGHFKKQ